MVGNKIFIVLKENGKHFEARIIFMLRQHEVVIEYLNIARVKVVSMYGDK